MLERKKPEIRKRVLVLIDFENLLINAREIEPTNFSIESGFQKIIESITEEIGEIIGMFAFLPSDRAMVWGADLHCWGFNIVLCPRIKDKEGKEQDTTDDKLIELGEWLINHLNDLTHICLGSGDKDFSLLMRKAALKGLKRIVFAANLTSLSSELIALADTNPQTRKKMVYLFSPTKR